MRERAPEWLKQAGVGIVLGLALGIMVGWWLWPVTYTNTSPAALRDDYQDDYVLMTAAAYAVEHDLAAAQSRLEELAPESPITLVEDLATALTENGGDQEDIAQLQDLADALEDTSSALTPFPEDSE